MTPQALGDRLSNLRPSSVFLVVFIPLLAVFLGTANRNLPYHIDSGTNVITAWSIGTTGTVFLDNEQLADKSAFRNIGWFVKTPDGRVTSQYPPGAALLAAPLYSVFDQTVLIEVEGENDPDAPTVWLDLPSLVPASVVAAGSTAAAAAFLAMTMTGLVENQTAILGGLIGGLATGAWSVASNELWQHGPAMLWLSVAALLLSRTQYLPAGLAFGLAVLTRPPTALIAASAGVWITIRKRSLRPAALVAAGSVVGLAALLVYNAAVFGSSSVSGGYGSGFTEQLVDSGFGWYAANIALALFDPVRGLLVWAPFLVILIPGVIPAWRAATGWIQGAALGGILFFLVQLKTNRFSGGGGFFAYRYPLEALVALAPLLVLSYREWVARTSVRIRVFQAATALAIAAQAIGAFTL